MDILSDVFIIPFRQIQITARLGGQSESENGELGKKAGISYFVGAHAEGYRDFQILQFVANRGSGGQIPEIGVRERRAGEDLSRIQMQEPATVAKTQANTGFNGIVLSEIELPIHEDLKAQIDTVTLDPLIIGTKPGHKRTGIESKAQILGLRRQPPRQSQDKEEEKLLFHGSSLWLCRYNAQKGPFAIRRATNIRFICREFGLTMRFNRCFHISWLWIPALLWSGCGKEDQLERPDVSHLEDETEIRRFDRDLFAMDTLDIAGARADLETRYGSFAQVYFQQILGVDDPRIAPEGADAYLRGMLTHPVTRRVYDTVQLVYPDLQKEKKHFDQAFRYLRYYFPEMPPPVITTFVSEFSVANFIYGEDELALGLDLYLGEDYPYGNIDPSNPVFSAYLTRTYNRDHLVPRTLKPLIEDMAGPPGGDRLLDHIIRNGKMLYMLDLLLPGIPDSAKFEFTPQQLQWCRDNERDIWAYFTTENWLYSTDWKKFRKYVEYSPHSPGMPPEAPGRTGDWIGMQIVRAWLNRHPGAGPAALLAQRDAQAILEASRYKPRR